ncbi:MAG: hypothetical protein PHN31_01855 [Candidatus Gracilibacteria bacterium]|nr:hypothetical protein [Candidatus Gracilibacteria bacterium]
MKRSPEYIFETIQDIESLSNKLEAEGFLVESGFIRKFLIERKTNKQVQYELYINSRRTYCRIKKSTLFLYYKYVTVGHNI